MAGHETMPAMASVQVYESDSYRTSLEVEVLRLGSDDSGRHFAILDETILYPEGGGQPADTGRLGDVAVVDVQRVDGDIRHYLDTEIAIGPTSSRLDWPRRFDHMQQHTAQHLITAVAEKLHGWKTTSFHLQPEICDIELDNASAPRRRLAELEATVATEIRAARQVSARRVTPEQYAVLDVRSRGLPADHRGDIRLVEIDGIDVNTCGGTHLRSTAEIETVKLLGAESMRGGTRLRWIAGGRVRDRLGRGEERFAELRKLFGAGNDELAEVAGLKLDQLQQASRQVKSLTGRLADTTAEALSGRGEAVLDEHFDGDAGFLRQVAQRFSNAEHSGVVLLTASGDKGSFFAVAAGKNSELDVRQAGQGVAEILAARGGGSGRIFQGKAESLDRRDEAVAILKKKTTD